MAIKIESFAKDSEERRLEEITRNMKPEQARKYLEREATMYLNMAFNYSSDRRAQEKINLL